MFGEEICKTNSQISQRSFFTPSNRFQKLFWRGCGAEQYPDVSEIIFAFWQTSWATFIVGPLKAQSGPTNIFKGFHLRMGA